MKIDSFYQPKSDSVTEGLPSVVDPQLEIKGGHPYSVSTTDLSSLVTNYRKFLMGRCRMLTRGDRHDANELYARVMLKVCSETPDQLQQIRHLGGLA